MSLPSSSGGAPTSSSDYATYLGTWSSSGPEIVSFLGSLRCAHHAERFRDNDIDGSVILELGAEELKQLGVTKVGERVRLLSGIKELRRKCQKPLVSSLSSMQGGHAVVELRLNGSSTPPPQSSEVSPAASRRAAMYSDPPFQPPPATVSGGSSRRLNAQRPPPLHLQPVSLSGTTVRQQDSGALVAGSGAGFGAGAGGSSASAGSDGTDGSLGTGAGSSLANGSGLLTPRLGMPNVREPSPSLSSSSSPSQGRVPGPQPVANNGSTSTGRLRAPLPSVKSAIGAGTSPPRSGTLLGRRSPSPAVMMGTSSTSGALSPNGGASAFMDRPLPGIPGVEDRDLAAGYGASRKDSAGSLRGEALGRSGSVKLSAATASAGSATGSQHRKAGSIATSNAVNADRKGSMASSAAPSSAPSLHPFARTAPSIATSPVKRAFQEARSGLGGAPDGDIGRPSRSRTGSSDDLLTSTIPPSASAMSLEDVRRKTVKFILADDGSSRVVNLETCETGLEIMERALKKFGKWRGGVSAQGIGSIHSESESESEEAVYMQVDGWGVFSDRPSSEEIGDPLTEAQLLRICQASPTDRERDRGITLRRIRKPGTRKDMSEFFGEAPPAPLSPTSPRYFTDMRPRANNANKKINRASTVSVMSALGVPFNDNDRAILGGSTGGQASPKALPKSPSSGSSFLAGRGKRMYNFFGHRPPSELISNHLADYFPAARRKELERTQRNSMLRLSTKANSTSSRDSVDSSRSSETNRLPSRFSITSSINSDRLSRGSSLKMNITPVASDVPEVPRLSIDSPAPKSSGSDSQPPLLPPFEASGESLSESLKVYSPTERPASLVRPRRISSSSRYSGYDIGRRLRRKSETPSMITVDEITAEVEKHRASVISVADKEELHEAELPESEEEVVSDSESESEEEDDEDDEEEEVEEEDEHGKAFTSTGCEWSTWADDACADPRLLPAKRSIRWIKGALIGSGSFGQVFLGMDAQSGLLMAVKQVDLGVRNVGPGARKQEMVTAMQREIELLKELQHENIVQYLDSSIDEAHLNIFLEYVPGGSVAALLGNYGAFEELLVKNFVGQILRGLEYLHGRGIVHRDIKGANILVDNKGGVKISDFGISKKVETVGARGGHLSLQGSVFWMAPEAVQQKGYTLKADIWSVGCLIVEMLTGTHPFPDLTQMQAIFKIGTSGAKPTFPSDISAEAVDFLDKSFELDQARRPNASELLGHAFVAKTV